MPKQQFALERGGQKRLEISWDMGWKNFQIHLDNKLIGSIDSRNELDAGKSFKLPDKSTLIVKLKMTFFSSGIILERNGLPLPESINDPYQNIKNLYGFLYFLAVCNVLLGAITYLLKIERLITLGFGATTILMGIVTAGFAFWLMKKKSIIPLTLFLLVYAAESIYSYLNYFNSATMDVFVRIIIFGYMITGYKALKAIQQIEREQADKLIQPL
jgi:hypothetical protein